MFVSLYIMLIFTVGKENILSLRQSLDSAYIPYILLSRLHKSLGIMIQFARYNDTIREVETIFFITKTQFATLFIQFATFLYNSLPSVYNSLALVCNSRDIQFV